MRGRLHRSAGKLAERLAQQGDRLVEPRPFEQQRLTPYLRHARRRGIHLRHVIDEGFQLSATVTGGLDKLRDIGESQAAGGVHEQALLRSKARALFLARQTLDVPGEALAQVIITRLPFDPPTHPITEAKCEHIRDGGGNPFNELTLPDALIKFRQGAGRLIRTATDRGIVTLLDSRVLAKSYGRLFIDSLPQPAFTRLTRDDRDAKFRPFA